MMNWQRIWNDDGSADRFVPAKTITYIISRLYRQVINLRNWLYSHNVFRETKLPCPVISVGNITVGGTGKTPCVIMLAQMLQERGFKPAILSRGYGGHNSQPVNIVSDGNNILLTAEAAGDEPYLMARSLKGIPVIIGPKRVSTGRVAVNRCGADVLICDDAFQHRQIFRDINLVLLDSLAPLGNGHLLPRGSLREPATALARADAFILTRFNTASETDVVIRKLAQAKNIPFFSSTHSPVDLVRADYTRQLPLAELAGKNICAFAGIANPDSFKKTLEAAGANILSFNIFSDHHHYSSDELDNIKKDYINCGASFLLTTEKDGMRLQKYPEFLREVHLLRIVMEIVPDKKSLEKFILEKISNKVEG